MTFAEHVNCTILLVDDEVDLLNLFGIYLSRMGCTLYKADGGQAALDILAEVVPTVLVLDLAMPQVSGLDVLHAMRGDPRFASTRVVILTAVPIMLDQKDAEQAELVLVKPVTPRQLEQAVRKLLDA